MSFSFTKDVIARLHGSIPPPPLDLKIGTHTTLQNKRFGNSLFPGTDADHTSQNGYTNGHTNGHTNGFTNGHTNDYPDGDDNGNNKGNDKCNDKGDNDGDDNGHMADQSEEDSNPSDEEVRNSCLYFPFLREDVTYRDLLLSIRGIGRIRDIRIYAPSRSRPHCSWGEIKFFSHEAAANLQHLAATERFRVLGVTTDARWARPAIPEDPIDLCSRVLLLYGPSEIINMSNLDRVWGEAWPRGGHYHLENLYETRLSDYGATQLYCLFICWEQQAEIAMNILQARYRGEIFAAYSVDPCGA
ncbi:hypothetical protein F5Y09DRAFT_337268 [Xylaria sp. FL1042]|nr:hypothetical protein F5Y09DRAFT_337268 [Xylaria sp. FL1042]